MSQEALKKPTPTHPNPTTPRSTTHPPHLTLHNSRPATPIIYDHNLYPVRQLAGAGKLQ